MALSISGDSPPFFKNSPVGGCHTRVEGPRSLSIQPKCRCLRPSPLACRAASLRARRSLNKTLSNQQLSWDSVNGLHLHREDVAATADSKREGDEGEAPPAEAGEASQEQEQRGNDGEEHVLEPQPKCDICGITTTSQAHMEVSTPSSRCAYVSRERQEKLMDSCNWKDYQSQ